MKKSTKTLIEYLGVFSILTLNSSLAVVFYSYIENRSKEIIAVFILIFIIISSVIWTLINILIKKITIDRPVKEILNATKKMSKGDFNIYLLTDHKYGNYSTYDLIKEDLNLLARELSKNEVLKTDFISNVSHEIKTPLAVIKNYAQLLEDENLSLEQKTKYLHSLQNATKKLSNLVTNILKLNKLENQKIIPSFKTFNLSNSIIEQIIQYENILEQKAINLICDIKEDILINNEESYLELIWSNLISNAIKFTPHNGEINISLKEVDGCIIFTIKDTGCGIPKETGKHIFDKFYQGDTSHSKEGNGLGLALVKKVIDIIGGQIIVESEVNVGTTFIVKLKGE